MLEVTHTKVILAYALQFSFQIYFNPVVVTAFLRYAIIYLPLNTFFRTLLKDGNPSQDIWLPQNHSTGL